MSVMRLVTEVFFDRERSCSRGQRTVSGTRNCQQTEYKAHDVGRSLARAQQISIPRSVKEIFVRGKGLCNSREKTPVLEGGGVPFIAPGYKHSIYVLEFG